MILVTGGMGFIGLHTARALLDCGKSVVATKHRSDAVPSFLAADFGSRFFKEPLDVATGTEGILAVVRRYNVAGIVHLAVPPLGVLSPAQEYRSNLDGLINVLEAAREAEVERVTIASSVTVYDGLAAGPYHEDARLPIASDSATEAYKKALETLGLFVARQCAFDVRIARIGYIYGPLYHSMYNLPSRLLHAALRGPHALPARVTPAPHAEDALDLSHVEDCARGIALVQTADRLQHHTYNVGAGEAVTNARVAEAVRAVVPGAEATLQPGTSSRARDNAALDVRRIRDELGYRPRYTIETGIAQYADWLRDGNPT